MEIKIPKWKRWLSYLFEIHIESAGAEVNPYLYVSMKKGRFQLSTDKAVYSYDDLYDNFTTAFEALDMQRFNPQSVLILGLGLGSVPYILEEKYKQLPYYTAVELDEEVIYLAEKYRLSTMKSSVQCIAADAEVFVSICQDRFDLVVIDLFIDDIIPEAFLSSSFIEQVKDLLEKGGLLMFNHLGMNDKQKQAVDRYMEDVFLKTFPEANFVPTRNNRILLNNSQYLK